MAEVTSSWTAVQGGSTRRSWKGGLGPVWGRKGEGVWNALMPAEAIDIKPLGSGERDRGTNIFGELSSCLALYTNNLINFQQ